MRRGSPEQKEQVSPFKKIPATWRGFFFCTLFDQQALFELQVGGDIGGLIADIDDHAGLGAAGLFDIFNQGVIDRHLGGVGGICIFRVVWIFFILPLNNTLDMIVYSYPISWVLTGLLYIIYYFKKRQQFPDTDEPDEAQA